MTKVYNLFDPDNFLKRKEADQEAFEAVHNQDFPGFVMLIEDAFKMMKAESKKKAARFKNRNYHAVIMSGNISGLLLERFPEQVKEGIHGRIMFSREGKYCLYFKKLDGKKMPNNIQTEYAELVAYQRTLSGTDRMPIIFIGYTVDDQWSSLTGFYAVYIHESKRIWVSVLNGTQSGDLTADNVVPVSPVSPGIITPSKVKVKKKTG